MASRRSGVRLPLGPPIKLATMKLKDKVAIVTGASTGIGRTIAIALAKQGMTVALVARTKNRLEETKQLIENEKGNVEIFIADLSNINSINALISDVKSTFKSIDVLVNVAGIWHGDNEVFADKDFDTFPQKVILDTYHVGTIAPTLLTHALIPFMLKGSRIINISGTFESGAKGWLPYFVSKRGIEDLTIGLAEELKERGITVNAISPSDAATEAYKKYFPQYLVDAIEPAEISKFAVYLCSPEASDISGKVFVLKKGKKPFEGYHT